MKKELEIIINVLKDCYSDLVTNRILMLNNQLLSEREKLKLVKYYTSLIGNLDNTIKELQKQAK